MIATLLPPSPKTLNSSQPNILAELIYPETEAVAFPAWLTKASPLWQWDVPHLRLIQDALDRVTRGEINRLILTLPPRHSKSETTTIRYSAWRLIQQPDMRVIVAAYNQTLANKFSRKIRKITREFIPLSTERQAVEDWETVEGGGVRAVGVGGGITGQGGNLIIIDDPVKNRQEADSPVYREHVWDWYTDDLYTRLEPDAAIILIMTRWHQDDLAGRILASEDGPNWTVLHLPALAIDNDALGREPGQALWPERYDVDALNAIRMSIGERGWYALYQGMPRPDGGASFLREWWEQGRNRYDPTMDYYAKASLARYISWDTANKDKVENAYTACVVADLLPDYTLIVREVWRDRLTFPALPDTIAEIAYRYNRDGKLAGILIEDRASGTSAVQTLQASADDWLASLIIPFQPSGSKEQRADQAAVWCKNDMVLLPHPSDAVRWLHDFEAELWDAPNGTFMDQVDAFSQLIIYLEHYLSAGWHARGTNHVAA